VSEPALGPEKEPESERVSEPALELGLALEPAVTRRSESAMVLVLEWMSDPKSEPEFETARVSVWEPESELGLGLNPEPAVMWASERVLEPEPGLDPEPMLESEWELDLEWVSGVKSELLLERRGVVALLTRADPAGCPFMAFRRAARWSANDVTAPPVRCEIGARVAVAMDGSGRAARCSVVVADSESLDERFDSAAESSLCGML